MRKTHLDEKESGDSTHSKKDHNAKPPLINKKKNMIAHIKATQTPSEEHAKSTCSPLRLNDNKITWAILEVKKVSFGHYKRYLEEEKMPP